MALPRSDSNTGPAKPQEDPFVPVIIESLRARGHLPRRDLETVTPWDRAKVIFETVTADDVFAAWQLVKRAGSPEFRAIHARDFTHKLDRWLNG